MLYCLKYKQVFNRVSVELVDKLQGTIYVNNYCLVTGSKLSKDGYPALDEKRSLKQAMQLCSLQPLDTTSCTTATTQAAQDPADHHAPHS